MLLKLETACGNGPGCEIALPPPLYLLTACHGARSRKLKEVHYSPPAGGEGIDEALAALSEAECLKVLELHPQGALMTAAQLRRTGQLPLTELRLESSSFRSMQAITPASQSHLDDHGIRALVDSICRRWRIDCGELRACAGAPVPGPCAPSAFWLAAVAMGVSQ